MVACRSSPSWRLVVNFVKLLSLPRIMKFPLNKMRMNIQIRSDALIIILRRQTFNDPTIPSTPGSPLRLHYTTSLKQIIDPPHIKPTANRITLVWINLSHYLRRDATTPCYLLLTVKVGFEVFTRGDDCQLPPLYFAQ